MVIIKHRQFIIRRYVAKDAMALVKYFGDPAVIRGVRGSTWKYRRADANKFLNEKLRQYRRRRPAIKNNETDTLGYAIEIDGQFAGGVGVTLAGRKAEIGYWLARPYWGQGTMTMIVREWTNYIFKKFKLSRVEAKVFPFNRASVRVLQKNRFKFEARLVRSHRAGHKFLDDLIFIKTGR